MCVCAYTGLLQADAGSEPSATRGHDPGACPHHDHCCRAPARPLYLQPDAQGLVAGRSRRAGAGVARRDGDRGRGAGRMVLHHVRLRQRQRQGHGGSRAAGGGHAGRGNRADGGRQLVRREALAERLGDRNRVQTTVVAVGLLRRVLHSREAAAAHAAHQLLLRPAGDADAARAEHVPVDHAARNQHRTHASAGDDVGDADGRVVGDVPPNLVTNSS